MQEVKIINSGFKGGLLNPVDALEENGSVLLYQELFRMLQLQAQIAKISDEFMFFLIAVIRICHRMVMHLGCFSLQ